MIKVKVGFLYSIAYNKTRPARFAIAEVAVDRQELNGAAAQYAAIHCPR